MVQAAHGIEFDEPTWMNPSRTVSHLQSLLTPAMPEGAYSYAY
jgi:hypothetical protein